VAAGLKAGQWREAVFIDGEFRKPSSKGTLDVRDKASGEIFATAVLRAAAEVLPTSHAGRFSLSEAVALANDTNYGLVDAVLTGDPSRGLNIARRLRAGMVHVNDATPQDEVLAPFGGLGQSGLGGRSGGDANIEEFTERRWLTVNTEPAHYPY
jgi:acyl-CoA reductase-like NAD-dependent aldehyde dehydrogenase